MKGYGSHKVPEGVWSDDTAMTLATMDSIIKTKTINYNDMADKFCSWLLNGEYTATNLVFNVGMTTNLALQSYQKCKGDATSNGLRDISNNGNGSLMRMLPIAFYCYYKQSSDDEILEIVINSSCITHGHELSIMGCYIYVNYILITR